MACGSKQWQCMQAAQPTQDEALCLLCNRQSSPLHRDLCTNSPSLQRGTIDTQPDTRQRQPPGNESQPERTDNAASPFCHCILSALSPPPPTPSVRTPSGRRFQVHHILRQPLQLFLRGTALRRPFLARHHQQPAVRFPALLRRNCRWERGEEGDCVRAYWRACCGWVGICPQWCEGSGPSIPPTPAYVRFQLRHIRIV